MDPGWLVMLAMDTSPATSKQNVHLGIYGIFIHDLSMCGTIWPKLASNGTLSVGSMTPMVNYDCCTSQMYTRGKLSVMISVHFADNTIKLSKLWQYLSFI